jgi:hypothetical protein
MKQLYKYYLEDHHLIDEWLSILVSVYEDISSERVGNILKFKLNFFK